ncbi:MFS transporter [Botrimarina hoheduenensis]|uniref:Major Facilitator Superfamily protein n=1 Tax=Botrimarina hoheduenensis TaxID=2528000 RepID=A0A5C5WD01_9BACT|nr:MFS transporter [Botrimarina hoheduenensis]TWT48367.1 Major Facilitator Superfamily protein [Botrimarina hoheduenensis]
MSSVADPAASPPPSKAEGPLGLASDAPDTDYVAPHADCPQRWEAGNFVWLALHQLLLRVGWIFKTESIIIPYFMDVVGGGPVMQGSLMLFNRLGFSIPPALYARRLKLMPEKRWAVFRSTLGMAVPFALLSILWASGAWRSTDDPSRAAWWMPYLFMVAYGVFFCLTGINQLALHAINGKVIRAERRGRLFTSSVVVGAPIAVACAWWLMTPWLKLADGGFTWLFAAPAFAFAVASLTMLGVRELPDAYEEASSSAWSRLSAAWRLATAPGPCRGVATVALLSSTSFTLFPHFQALGRSAAGGNFDLEWLMLWSITQHLAVAALSLLAGPIADRFGNRLAVQLCVFGAAAAPLIAIALATLPAEAMGRWYWLVFIALGFTPVMIKMLINYTLELVEREHHTQLIAAIGLCLAAPVIVGSPIVGWLVGVVGCTPVFALGALVLLIAGARTLWLSEPRHAAP